MTDIVERLQQHDLNLWPVWRCRTSDIRLADCPREDLGVAR